MSVRDYAAAEAAYRRARERHTTLVAPRPPNLAWAAPEGIGNALVEQKRWDEAAKVLAESKAESARTSLQGNDLPHTSLALAIALAQLGRWPDALRELTAAVDGDPRWLKRAHADPDLDAAWRVGSGAAGERRTTARTRPDPWRSPRSRP